MEVTQSKIIDIYIIPLENYIDNLFIEQKKYKYNG